LGQTSSNNDLGKPFGYLFEICANIFFRCFFRFGNAEYKPSKRPLMKKAPAIAEETPIIDSSWGKFFACQEYKIVQQVPMQIATTNKAVTILAAFFRFSSLDVMAASLLGIFLLTFKAT